MVAGDFMILYILEDIPMDSKQLDEIYLKYCSIKTRAKGGIRISRTEAKEALRLKKILNKHNFFENREDSKS